MGTPSTLYDHLPNPLIVLENQEQDAILITVVAGPMGFREEKDKIIYMLNWREAVQLYEEHCKEHNLEIIGIGQH